MDIQWSPQWSEEMLWLNTVHSGNFTSFIQKRWHEIQHVVTHFYCYTATMLVSPQSETRTSNVKFQCPAEQIVLSCNKIIIQESLHHLFYWNSVLFESVTVQICWNSSVQTTPFYMQIVFFFILVFNPLFSMSITEWLCLKQNTWKTA